MKKRNKLFAAYEGDAIGLRDCLVEHFKHMETLERDQPRGEDYSAGITAGRASAFSDAVIFLKKIVINAAEFPEVDNAAGQ